MATLRAGFPFTFDRGLPLRLEALRPTIEKLMYIGGTPGLSLSVIYNSCQFCLYNYGFRDLEKRLPVTGDTIWPVGSLTKAVTAAAMGILVEENKVKWDTLVKDVLPAFKISDTILQDYLTVTDLLCHRAGISWGDNLVVGTDNNVLISEKDSMEYINSHTRLLPFRGQFAYSNIAFELAGKVIEALSGESWFDFVQRRILDPLGMERTFLKTPPSDVDDVGNCYNALDDATVAPIPCAKAGDDWFLASSAGIRSCTRDLTTLYNAFLRSFKGEFATCNTSTLSSPLKQVKQLMSAKIPIDQPSRNETSYALGWVRVQLPGRMGQVGMNPGLMPDGMPIVGKGVPSQLVVFHQGSMPGCLSIAILLPATERAIVILTNSLALNDVADWVGQLVLEELLEVPKEERNDYIEAAKISAAENLKWYPALVKELEQTQKKGTSPRSLENYVGTYWDDIHVFKIVVTLEGQSLYWLLQGLESEKFQLNHYEEDTFTWLLPRNELSKRGRRVGRDQGPLFWKVEFKGEGSETIDKLCWGHDKGVPVKEFKKEIPWRIEAVVLPLRLFPIIAFQNIFK